MKIYRAICIIAAAPVILAAPTRAQYLPEPNGYDGAAEEQSTLLTNPDTSRYEQADREMLNRISNQDFDNYEDEGVDRDEEEKHYMFKPTHILDEKRPIPTAILMDLTRDKNPEIPPSRPVPSKSFSRFLPSSYSLSGKLFEPPSTPRQRTKPCHASPFSKDGTPENPNPQGPTYNNLNIASLLGWISNNPSRAWIVVPALLVFLFLVTIVAVEVVTAIRASARASSIPCIGGRHSQENREGRRYPWSRIRLRGSEQKIRAVTSEKEDLQPDGVEPA